MVVALGDIRQHMIDELESEFKYSTEVDNQVGTDCNLVVVRYVANGIYPNEAEIEDIYTRSEFENRYERNKLIHEMKAEQLLQLMAEWYIEKKQGA